MRSLLCKSLVLPLLVVTGFLTGCARNNFTLYPLETKQEVSGRCLNGKWLVLNDSGESEPDGKVYATLNWNDDKKILLIDLYGSEINSSKIVHYAPMTGKIYELDQEKFLCVTTDTKALGKILEKNGYAKDLILIQPIFCTMKIDITPEQVILYMLHYGDDDAGKTDEDKFFSPKLRYDKKLQLIMNDTRELAEILHDKSYQTKKWLILKPIPKTETSGLTDQP